MSESEVFELKLQIQHLEEKLAFLAGGTNGAELVAVLMEKDAELEQKNKKLKEVESSRFQLAESAKKVDARRREAMRQAEHQLVRVQALERELERQLGISDEQRRKLADTKEELALTKRELQRTQAEMASKEAAAQESLETARSEASSLQRMVEGQRETISKLESAKKDLEETVLTKEGQMKSLEQRKKDIASRSREMKNHLEKLVLDAQKAQADLVGQRSALEAEVVRMRRRMEEKAKIALEEERKTTALARECGNLKTELEAARQDITSAAEELAAVRLTKKEADEALIGKDKENNKLRTKNESLRVEMDRRLHQINQEKGDLSEKMEESIRELKEREDFLHGQLEATGRENKEIQDAQASQIREIEEQLRVSKEDMERLKADARKSKAQSKSEARWRARAEDVMAGRAADLERAHAEVAAMKHQGVEIRHLEAENKDLKARIERQEAFHKRRMEKEKKEKRGIRSGSSTRTPTMGGNGSTASGRTQLLPLPPLMGSYGEDEDGRGGGSATRRPSMTPTSAGRGGEGDTSGGGGGGGGGSGRELVFTSERPLSASSPRQGSSGNSNSNSPCFFSSSPESSSREKTDVADKENKVVATQHSNQARAPAWEAGGGSGSKAGKSRRESSGSKCGAGVLSGRTATAPAVARGTAGPPPENSKIRSVAARSPATRSGLQDMNARQSGSARSTSRGRSAVAARAAGPRSSSLGIQSRAASGWR